MKIVPLLTILIRSPERAACNVAELAMIDFWSLTFSVMEDRRVRGTVHIALVVSSRWGELNQTERKVRVARHGYRLNFFEEVEISLDLFPQIIVMRA